MRISSKWRIGLLWFIGSHAFSALLAHTIPQDTAALLGLEVHALTWSTLRQADSAARYVAMAEGWRNAHGYFPGTSYDRLGNNAARISDYTQAYRWYNQAVQVRAAQLGENHMETLSSTLSLGYVSWRKRDYYQAEAHFFKVKDVLERIPSRSPRLLAKTYNRLGVLYWDTSRLREAEQMYRKALALLDRHPELSPVHRARILDNLALVYNSTRRTDQALQLVKNAMKQFQLDSTEYPMDLARSYNNMASVAYMQRDYEQAIAYAERALRLKKQLLGDVHPDICQIYLVLAEIAEEQGEADRALGYAQNGLAAVVRDWQPEAGYTAEAFPESHILDEVWLARTLGVLSRVAFGHQRPSEEQLKITYDAAVSAWETVVRIRSQLHHLESHLTLNRRFSSLPALAVAASYLRYQINQDEIHLRRAWWMMEQGRNNALRQAWDHSSHLTQLGLAEATIDTLRSWERDIRSARQRLITQKNGREAASHMIYTRQRQLDSLEARLAREVPAYGQYRQMPHTADTTGVCDMLQRTGSLLVSYQWCWPFLGGADFPLLDSMGYFVLATDGKDFTLRHFTYDDCLDTALSQLLATLTSPPAFISETDMATQLQTFAEKGYMLFTALIGPELTAFPQPSVLTILPDGPLYSVSFETLLTESVDRPRSFRKLPYLLHRRTISYEFGSSFLVDQQTGSTEIDNYASYVGYAPAYAPSEDLLASVRDALPHDLRDVRWTDLAYNQKEVQSVAQLLKGETRKGPQASENQFKKEAGQYQVVHIAGHAFTQDSLPFYSGLILSRPEVGIQEDGVLYAYELAGMHIPASLVVLSACQTGAGNFSFGEGVMSLGYAFKWAGTHALASSLWQADDQSSHQVIQGFFEGMHEGMPKHEALQKSKEYFLATSPEIRTHPFYWGAFVLMGNTEPLYSSLTWMQGVGIPLLIVLLSIGWFFFSWWRWRKRKTDT